MVKSAHGKAMASVVLISWSFHSQKVAAEAMVMPRSPLQLHGIHGCADAVLALDFVNGMWDALGVIENPLGQRGLARVDVGADPDVPDFLNAFFMTPFLSPPK